ncbi:MAG TPA: hypothetical protein PK490_14730, partial [Prosthecobacter sp.]|nr:hypothetical protein [Prosthecobacter sp.]
ARGGGGEWLGLAGDNLPAGMSQAGCGDSPPGFVDARSSRNSPLPQAGRSGGGSCATGADAFPAGHTRPTTAPRPITGLIM